MRSPRAARRARRGGRDRGRKLTPRQFYTVCEAVLRGPPTPSRGRRVVDADPARLRQWLDQFPDGWTTYGDSAAGPPPLGGGATRPVRRLGDAGPVRGHPRRAPRRAHARPACSTSRTWARSRRAGPQALAFLQRMLSNDVSTDRRRRRPVQRAVPRGRRRARRPLHLPPRRGPLPDGHERRQPRAATSRGSRAHAEGFDVEVLDRARRLRDARRAGPAGARDRRRRSPTAPLPARFRTARAAASPARRARLRHRLHGRGRRRAARRAATTPARVGRARRRRRRRRPGSARATRCAWRPASTSTATT